MPNLTKGVLVIASTKCSMVSAAHILPSTLQMFSLHLIVWVMQCCNRFPTTGPPVNRATSGQPDLPCSHFPSSITRLLPPYLTWEFCLLSSRHRCPLLRYYTLPLFPHLSTASHQHNLRRFPIFIDACTIYSGVFLSHVFSIAGCSAKNVSRAPLFMLYTSVLPCVHLITD